MKKLCAITSSHKSPKENFKVLTFLRSSRKEVETKIASLKLHAFSVK